MVSFYRYTFVLPLSLSLSLPAWAGIAKNVSQEDAAEGRVSVVVAAEGGGTILDFSETQETLMKVTLDDPSKVVIDYSAPLPVIRLFRARIPAPDVPAVQQTQLTVITQSSDRQYHTYIFSVLPSAKPAIYTKFLIGGVTRRRGFTDVSTVVSTASGIRQAEQQHTLVDPMLKGRVRKYLQLTQAGMSDRQAAIKAGISMPLVQRLETLGQGSTQVVRSLPVPGTPVPSQKPLVVNLLQRLDPPQVAQAEVQPEHKHRHKSHLFEHGAESSPQESVAPDQGVTQNRTTNELWASAVVVPPGAVQSNRPSSVIQPHKKLSNQTYANALSRGLNKARIEGKIHYGSTKWYQVNGAIRVLRRGSSLDKAIAVSGLQKDKFMKLLSDGGIES